MQTQYFPLHKYHNTTFFILTFSHKIFTFIKLTQIIKKTVRGGEKTMELDQATISSYVILILTPIMGYFAVSSETANAIYGVITAIIMLLLACWNEKHNSTVISGETETHETTE